MKLHKLPKNIIVYFDENTEATFLGVDGMYGKWKVGNEFKIGFLANTEIEVEDGKYFLKK